MSEPKILNTKEFNVNLENEKDYFKLYEYCGDMEVCI